jgi:uncharacterized protein (TIGR02996 family)
MDDYDVQAAALAAWRHTKHPRWGDLADWATARALSRWQALPPVSPEATAADLAKLFSQYDDGGPLEVPMLLAAVGNTPTPLLATRCLRLLARRDDPRLVTWTLALLEATTPDAAALNLFDVACASLTTLGDVRALERLRTLGTRLEGLGTSVGHQLASRCVHAVNELARLPAAPLTSEDEDQLVPLEGRRARTAAAATTRLTRSPPDGAETRALAAVYEDPDDDAARLVFADLLTERGDERGEFISLQVERARTGGTSHGHARERSLLDQTGREATWSSPLPPAHLERGFPVNAWLRQDTPRPVLDSEAWATVHRVGNLHHLGLQQARALLANPRLRRVRELSGLPQEVLELAPVSHLTGLSLTFSPSSAQLARFPGLLTLKLASAPEPPFDGRLALQPDALEGAPLLRSLVLESCDLHSESFLAHVPHLQSLRLSGCDLRNHGFLSRVPQLRELILNRPLTAQLLEPLTQLERLGSVDLDPKAVRGLPLTHLACFRGLDLEQLAALLDGLPRLDTLQVGTKTSVPNLASLPALLATRLRRVMLGDLVVTRAAQGTTLELGSWAPHWDLKTCASAFASGEVRRVALRVGNLKPTPAERRLVLKQVRQAFPEAVAEWDDSFEESPHLR